MSGEAPPVAIDAARREPRWRVVLVVTLAYAGLLLVLAQFGTPNERVDYDTRVHHLPVILKFASEWPKPGLADYAVASTPGYHLVLSIVARFVSADAVLLRCVGAIFSLLLAGTMAWSVGASWRTIVLAAPLLLSPYVVTSGIWLLPENAAWWLVVVVLALALNPREGWRYLAVLSVSLAGLIVVRQAHAWAMAPVAVALLCRSKPLATRVMEIAAVLILPIAVLVSFLVLWHGFTPPMFQPGAPPQPGMTFITYGQPSLAPAGMTLAMLGGFGIFFLPILWRRLPQSWVFAGVGIAAIVAAIPESVPIYPFRYGGLFSILGWFERHTSLASIHGRSILFIALAAVGGLIVAVSAYALDKRSRWVWIAALIGFILAHLNNPMIWQRYYEPFVLILLALAASRGMKRWDAATIAGPVLLALILLAMTLHAIAII
jgi:hypothetical protein